MTLKNQLRVFSNRLLKSIGLTLQRVEIEAQLDEFQELQLRKSLAGMLQQAKAIGFVPGTVLDVGAAYGTSPLYTTFPQAHHLLIEPLEEYKSYLDHFKQKYTHLDYILAGASDHDQGLIINIDQSKVGSSVYRHKTDSDIGLIQREIPTIRLDKVCLERNLPKPFLIKIDVQGAELDVLRGATDILNETEYVVMETSFFEFAENTPQFYDIISFMKERNFVAYDLSEGTYRPLDNAMAQVDIAFVKDNGLFRQSHEYATSAQFKELYATLAEHAKVVETHHKNQ